jgi:co-chaperonin GroES (HSP10)
VTNPIQPKHDYLLVEVLENETGVVKTEDIRDTKQKGRVLAVGPGTHNEHSGVFVPTATEVGEIVYWEEAAEANTPAYFKNRDLYLVKEARLIACEADPNERVEVDNDQLKGKK